MTTDTGLTLEQVAEVCDVPRYAALCRAAQRVIEAAKQHQLHCPYGNGWTLQAALAAYDAVSRGETP